MRKKNLDLESVRADYKDKAYVRERIDKLKFDLSMIARLDPPAKVKYIRKAVGYDEFLKKYSSERYLDPESLFEIAEEIEASASGFRTYAEWKEHIERYTEDLKQRHYEKQDKKEEAGVNLLTFHAAKGLEFDSLFILDVSEEYTPYRKAASSKEIEEERRMFYVAVTRAKNRLFLLHPTDRLGRKQIPSRFLKEMELD